MHNIEMLYKAWNQAIKFYGEYSSMISEAKAKATKETGPKILTPKQMLQGSLAATKIYDMLIFNLTWSLMSL